MEFQQNGFCSGKGECLNKINTMPQQKAFKQENQVLNKKIRIWNRKKESKTVKNGNIRYKANSWFVFY